MGSSKEHERESSLPHLLQDLPCCSHAENRLGVALHVVPEANPIPVKYAYSHPKLQREPSFSKRVDAFIFKIPSWKVKEKSPGLVMALRELCGSRIVVYRGERRSWRGPSASEAVAAPGGELGPPESARQGRREPHTCLTPSFPPLPSWAPCLFAWVSLLVIASLSHGFCSPELGQGVDRVCWCLVPRACIHTQRTLEQVCHVAGHPGDRKWEGSQVGRS